MWSKMFSSEVSEECEEQDGDRESGTSLVWISISAQENQAVVKHWSGIYEQALYALAEISLRTPLNTEM